MLDNMQDILAAVAAGTLTPDEAEERISALDAQAQQWEVVDEEIPTSNAQGEQAKTHFTINLEDELGDLGERINKNVDNLTDTILHSLNSSLGNISTHQSSYRASGEGTTDKTVIKGDYMNSISGNMDKKTRIEGDMIGSVGGDMLGTVTGDLMGSIGGSMLGTVAGDLRGNIGGNLSNEASVYGDLHGNIAGNMGGTIRGDLLGTLKGNMDGCIYGDMMGDIHGHLNGTIKGDMSGTVSGNLCGIVSGDVMGTIKGDVRGTINGDVECILGDIKEGAVIKGDVHQLHGQCYGKVYGSILSGKIY